MDNKVEKTIKALQEHGFKAVYVKDRGEAKNLILEMAKGFHTVGVGGTSTVRATGVVEAMKKQGYEVLDHWTEKNPAKIMEIRKAQMTSDVFLTGSNAVTMTGELVNREGAGNRTNAMTFGPKKVIVVAGINKIVEDVPAGMERIKTIAAPKRARELNMKTPCAEKGVCCDCNSPQRICRITIVHERKPMLTDVTIIIVGEELGN